MSELKTLLIAMAFASIASTVGASTLWGHFTLSAPNGTTDLHIKFNDADGQSMGDVEIDPLGKGTGSVAVFLPGSNTLVGRLGDGLTALTEGAEVTVKFSITSNDLFISQVVDAWWTRNDVKFGPSIDSRSMTLRSGNALPNDAIQIANVPLPAAMPLLLIALGGLGFAARRCKTT